MVEVFKTNVDTVSHTEFILLAIRALNKHYRVNFDLEDCDRILRVENPLGHVNSQQVVNIMAQHGYCAEILGH